MVTFCRIRGTVRRTSADRAVCMFGDQAGCYARGSGGRQVCSKSGASPWQELTAERSPSTFATPSRTGHRIFPRRHPRAPPNVLIIAWDDVGYGSMDIFGGPDRDTHHAPDRGPGGCEVLELPYHRAVFPPTRASLLTGRNATTNGMATIAEFSAGFPGISTHIPFENGFVSEVLGERGWNTYCVGKWHLTPPATR